MLNGAPSEVTPQVPSRGASESARIEDMEGDLQLRAGDGEKHPDLTAFGSEVSFA